MFVKPKSISMLLLFYWDRYTDLSANIAVKRSQSGGNVTLFTAARKCNKLKLVLVYKKVAFCNESRQ